MPGKGPCDLPGLIATGCGCVLGAAVAHIEPAVSTVRSECLRYGANVMHSWQ